MRIADRTRSRVSSSTFVRLFATRDTVWLETPASSATSAWDGGRWASIRRSTVGWRFVGPFMALFALVFLAPIGYSIYLSLFRTRLIGGTKFVGAANYAEALKDAQFWSSVSRVALFLAVQVPIM